MLKTEVCERLAILQEAEDAIERLTRIRSRPQPIPAG